MFRAVRGLYTSKTAKNQLKIDSKVEAADSQKINFHMLRYQRDAAVYNVTSKLEALGLKLLLDLSLDYTPLWTRTAREPKAG